MTNYTDELQDFSEGDTVVYDDEDHIGVITGKMTENFDWPAENVPEDIQAEEQPDDGEDTRLKASSEEPLYLVARETGGSKPFHGEDLDSISSEEAFGDEDANPEKLATEAEMAPIYSRVNDPFDFGGFEKTVEELQNIPGVKDPDTGFDDLPDGWTRKSVLQAWSSLGGTFRTCRAQMSGEIRSPTRFCAALKDEVYQTTAWRGF